MRLPNLTKYNSGNDSHIEKKIDHVLPCDIDINIITDKDKTKFIKSTEKVIRSSPEYKEYIKYLKQNIDLTSCSFFSKINSKDGRRGNVKIEMHHEPFTLYDITEIVFNRQLNEGDMITYISVAEEVMKIHYQNLVGLIPLTRTVHELVGSGKLFIPLTHIYGDFTKFVEIYRDCIDSSMHEMVMSKIKMTNEINDVSILHKKYVYLDVDGMSLPQPVAKD